MSGIWFVDGARPATPTDFFGGGRAGWWTYEVLDRAGRTTGRLGDDSSAGIVVDGAGDVSLSTSREIRGMGSLTWEGPHTDEPPWRDLLIRAWYHAQVGGVVADVPMGVYHAATPRPVHRVDQVTVPVELYDRTWSLAKERTRQLTSLPAGAPIVDTITGWVQDVTGALVAADPSDAVLRSQITWDAGTSMLRKINDLAAAAGFFSLHADPMGAFTLARYVRPEDRPVAVTLVAGEDAAFADGIELEDDSFDTVNRVTLQTRPADDTDEVLTATVTVDEEYGTDHPLSFARRGYWVDPDDVEVVEATDAAALAAAARQCLADAVQRSRTVDPVVFPRPVEMNSVWRLLVPQSGLDVTGSVQSLAAPTSSSASWTVGLRQLASSLGREVA